MLSIASRGGFKLGTLIFTVALLTASLTALQTLTASYSDNVELIQRIALTPRFSLDKDQGTMIEINVHPINDVNVFLVAPSKLPEYLSISGVRDPPENLGENDVIISTTLQEHTVDGKITIKDKNLRVVMALNLPQDTVILTSTALNRLTPGSMKVYVSPGGEGRYSQAPSTINLVKGLATEVQSIISSTGGLFFISLAVMAIIQATYVFEEGKESMQVFKALHAPNHSITASLLIVVFLVSGLTMVIGYSLGIVASSSISLLANLFIGTPYIKPVFSTRLFWSLILGFASIFTALSIGYIRGYRNVSVD
jgi:hypothetical protein